MAPFGVTLLVAASRKTHVFSIQKMKNGFLLNKLEPSFGNIVCHHKTEACAKFGHIIINYSTDAAISLLVWLEMLGNVVISKKILRTRKIMMMA